uniref:Uncharacterized protein n=1 Tax=Bracon brevicornis TaxID=1563983 RepID=A0A6V7IHL1_9HYME
MLPVLLSPLLHERLHVSPPFLPALQNLHRNVERLRYVEATHGR